MTSPTEPRTPRLYHGEPRAPRIAFDPAIATAVVAAAMAGFLVVGAIVPLGAALIAGQLVLLAVPVGAALIHRDALAVLGLRLPRVTTVVAAVLIGCSLWYVNLRVVTALLEHGILPTTTGDAHRLDQLVDRGSLATVMITLAVLPPLCEEVVFRGVLARGLATRLPAIAAIAISAAVFSAYHFSWLQAVPTFVLGLALGAVTLRGDSIVPGMLAHALNNSIAVLITRDALPSVTGWIDHNPTPMLVGCVGIVATGVVLVARPT